MRPEIKIPLIAFVAMAPLGRETDRCQHVFVSSKKTLES